jgi:hypothetical protein
VEHVFIGFDLVRLVLVSDKALDEKFEQNIGLPEQIFDNLGNDHAFLKINELHSFCRNNRWTLVC